MYNQPLPNRVRLLVLGGGIHGVGVLHDMASRGWRDVHLVEKGSIGCGTSSRSTKLIHGGLRYLQNIRDFGLVAEALKERTTLRTLAEDLVKPLELYLPVLKKGGLPGFVLRTGLRLYDVLAGRHQFAKHRVITDPEELRRDVSHLNLAEVSKVLSFWDMQTDDLGLVRRVAASATKLGAGISEGCEVIKVSQGDDGWLVDVRRPDGSMHTISALYVMNALGPWANRILEASQIRPAYRGVNSKGAHLLLKDIGHKAGLFLQAPEDKRIFFVLPWEGYTLIGTTEDVFADDPNRVHASQQDVDYLLQHCNRYLHPQLKSSDVIGSFAGLRWLAVDEGRDLGNTSRAYVIGESTSARGLLLTLYGGKLTTYRNLAKTIGDRITTHFGEFRPSQTHEAKNWATRAETPKSEATALVRFQAGGVAFSDTTFTGK